MRGVSIDDARRRRSVDGIAPAERRYVIVFSPRSGSSWLARLLSSTERLGFPEEYINPEFVVEVARFLDANEPNRFLDALVRRRKSENSVFGIKARALDVDLFGAEPFRYCFGQHTIFFHLWRRNLIAQAVSLYRAVETGRYHSTDASNVGPPAYNSDAVLVWMDQIAAIENANVKLLHQLGIGPRLICYEELIGKRQRALDLFSRVLAVPLPTNQRADDPAADDLVGVSDAWNVAAEDRFRREQPGLVQMYEERRLIKAGAGASCHPAPPVEQMELRAWRAGLQHGGEGWSPFPIPTSQRQSDNEAWLRGWLRGWDNQPYNGTSEG